MTKKGEETILDLPEYQKPAVSLSDHVNGLGMYFEVGGRQFYLRPPTPEEMNDVELLCSIEARTVALRDDVVALSKQPAPAEEVEALKSVAKLQHKALIAEEDNPELVKYWDERMERLYSLLEKRTSATSIIDEHVGRYRNTYMAQKLLQDADGKPVDFNALSPRVRTAILEKVSVYLSEINLLPFG